VLRGGAEWLYSDQSVRPSVPPDARSAGEEFHVSPRRDQGPGCLSAPLPPATAHGPLPFSPSLAQGPTERAAARQPHPALVSPHGHCPPLPHLLPRGDLPPGTPLPASPPRTGARLRLPRGGPGSARPLPPCPRAAGVCRAASRQRRPRALAARVGAASAGVYGANAHRGVRPSVRG
ncbi:hypothetical protein FKM82_018695, partial [Ascaphus truei]